MFNKFILLTFISVFFAGCASVPMESPENNDKAQRFNPPSMGNAGLYIFRDSSFGSALKKDIWIDGKCIGETAPNVFFYVEVDGNKEHKISTESEFSPNDLRIRTKSGMLYFIRQFIKMGLFVGGAGLELVDNKEGKQAVRNLKLAIKGTCSN